MRRAAGYSCFALTNVRRQGTSFPPNETEISIEHLKNDAEQKGFVRRDTPEGKLFMQQTLHSPEKIREGIVVANLPAKQRETTDFDQYSRSTTEFTSLVTPHGVAGVGLGAGFGAKEDKRLGFLRPRKPLQPFSGMTSIIPKYDENGMPVEEALTPDQMMKKRLDYLKSFDGMTMSQNEHFLLVDLDFEKDAMLFGNTREEFERNVIKLKKVIVAYNKWERTDNFYYYATVILKAMTLWICMECLHQYYELHLFQSHYVTFGETIEAEIANLDASRERDLEYARSVLKQNKPDFTPVIQAMMAEKAQMQTIARQRVDNTQRPESEDVAPVQGRGPSEAIIAGPLAELAQQREKSITRGPSLSQMDSTTSHPMDTTGEEAYNKLLARKEQETEMRRLHELSSKTGGYSVLRAFCGKVRGDKLHGLQPLQQDDFARYSYAASPTSIQAMRLVRRALLPRSEDYTQVVREEMADYKHQKERRSLFPS